MKKILFIFVVVLSIVSCVLLCSCDIATATEQANEKQSLIDSALPYNFVLVAQDPNTYEHISVYRDTLTDILYVSYRANYARTFSVLYDVDGLPLTYSRFCELFTEVNDQGNGAWLHSGANDEVDLE